MNAVSIRNLGKSYGEKRALADLSLDVPRGSLYGLIGPNGAGKTTTVRLLMNIYAPDSGTIEVLGGPISEATKSRIGYLPEERGLYTKMKVGELLVFLAAIKGIAPAEAACRAGRWLERMSLADCREKKVNELSKGMQQKVQFIATVLHEPELVILDEPFSGLDPLNTEVLREIMMEMHAEGRTIIFSTHIMETVERLCDRVFMISGGRKVLDGTLREIKGRFGRNAVALAFEGDGRFLEGHPLVRRLGDHRGYVEIRLVEGADPQALLLDAASKVRVDRFEIVEPSMHEIFIQCAQEAGLEAGDAAPAVREAAAPAPAR
jgi:ABC-2 type transport system ATP-binding protein